MHPSSLAPFPQSYHFAQAPAPQTPPPPNPVEEFNATLALFGQTITAVSQSYAQALQLVPSTPSQAFHFKINLLSAQYLAFRISQSIEPFLKDRNQKAQAITVKQAFLKALDDTFDNALQSSQQALQTYDAVLLPYFSTQNGIKTNVFEFVKLAYMRTQTELFINDTLRVLLQMRIDARI